CRVTPTIHVQWITRCVIIDQWYENRYLFDKYDIKATFFITRPHLLDAASITKLLELQAAGHEIACHGYNHKDIAAYKDSMDKYVQQEIIPAIELLTNMGFHIRSFAYPYGHGTPATDTLLLKYFKYIRKSMWNYRHTRLKNYNEIFANKLTHNIISSMGIDHNYRISLPSFRSGVIRAKEKGEVLILNAHNISKECNEEYCIPVSYLEELYKICKSNRIKSITIRELESYYLD
ncbi:MAG: polysaccharide deacetylase family protein, partial [Bacteroidales bacterium]